MRGDDDDDLSQSDAETVPSEAPGYVLVAQALEESGFTVGQLRALVGAGIIKTQRLKRGATAYCLEDLHRFDGMPRATEPDQSPVVAEWNAVTAGYRAMLELSLKQTKQAQDHERMLVAAFSKPLDSLATGSQNLLTAVLDQNKQLVTRASDGDAARLDFVKAAETMLRDQRAELREQAEADRKHQLRAEVWEGVKKAAPHLLEGFKQTVGTSGDDQLAAAMKLKQKLDIRKVASLVAFKMLDDEETGLLCQAFGYDRAELDRIAAEAAEVAAEVDAAEARDTEAPKAAE